MRRRPSPPRRALTQEELDCIFVQHQLRYARSQGGGDAEYDAEVAEALSLSKAEFMSKHDNDPHPADFGCPPQPPTSSRAQSIPNGQARPDADAKAQRAQAGEIEAVVRNAAKLRAILVQLPGVNPGDRRFAKFSRI
jgi:hypothetical protein